MTCLATIMFNAAVGERRFGLALVGPVMLAAVEIGQHCCGNRQGQASILGPGLDQQHFVGRILRQPVGKNASRRPGTNNDEIITHCHFPAVDGRQTRPPETNLGCAPSGGRRCRSMQKLTN